MPDDPAVLTPPKKTGKATYGAGAQANKLSWQKSVKIMERMATVAQMSAQHIPQHIIAKKCEVSIKTVRTDLEKVRLLYQMRQEEGLEHLAADAIREQDELKRIAHLHLMALPFDGQSGSAAAALINAISKIIMDQARIAGVTQENFSLMMAKMDVHELTNAGRSWGLIPQDAGAVQAQPGTGAEASGGADPFALPAGPPAPAEAG